MVNLEHKLTVDDLIVEYLVYKVQNGYETYFVGKEFMDFLAFFTNKFDVEDTLADKDILLERFYERKNKNDWHYKPHMDMEYKYEIYDYVMFANYKLSGFDLSVITTYFMNDKLVLQMRALIGDYLKDKPKKVINEKKKIDEDELLIGKYISLKIMEEIWDSYIKKQIKNNKWPSQCTDINKYLFKMDLAKTIDIPSIRDELIKLYKVFSKRIGILYHEDQNLKINSGGNVFLANANYDLLINNYEELMKNTFCKYQKSFNVDLFNLKYKDSLLGCIYSYDKDCNYEFTTNDIINNRSKSLVKTIDKIEV